MRRGAGKPGARRAPRRERGGAHVTSPRLAFALMLLLLALMLASGLDHKQNARRQIEPARIEPADRGRQRKEIRPAAPWKTIYFSKSPLSLGNWFRIRRAYRTARGDFSKAWVVSQES